MAAMTQPWAALVRRAGRRAGRRRALIAVIGGAAMVGRTGVLA